MTATNIRTLEEAADSPGVSIQDGALRLWFDPIPNWYVCVTGFLCPHCDREITWDWKGELPGVTTPTSIKMSGVHPIVNGAALLDWGHRYILLECLGCGTELYAHNFD